jgi:hypothetical protein
MWQLPASRRAWAIAWTLAAAGVVSLIAVLVAWRSRVDATPPSGPVLTPLTPSVPLPDPVAVATPGAADAGTHSASAATPTTAVTPQSSQARIMFSTIPPVNANVLWGKKSLGRIAPKAPLVILRPRDSGPLDVTITAPGYLPVQTRAHTFADTHVQVKLTTIEDKPTLWGYRAPLDAGVPLTPDDPTNSISATGAAPPGPAPTGTPATAPRSAATPTNVAPPPPRRLAPQPSQ